MNGKLSSMTFAEQNDGDNGDNGEKGNEYKLCDYYIKTAYNCCNGGDYANDYVDLCVLRALLKQGVRGLDFEVFSLDDDDPVIASSTSNSSYYVKETFNSIPFAEFIETVVNNGFDAEQCPNPLDPILLHFRFKSANQRMYSKLAGILQNYDARLMPKEYDNENNGANFGQVALSALQGKIVIIVDKSNTSYVQNADFFPFVNMSSCSVFMRAIPYYDIMYSPDLEELKEYNKQNMTISLLSGSNPTNPNPEMLKSVGVQMMGFRFQYVDENLELYETMFNQAQHAFVLKPAELRYKPILIDAPKEQNPELSYATKTISSDYYKFNI